MIKVACPHLFSVPIYSSGVFLYGENMKTKKSLIIVTIVVIFAVLVYLFLEKQETNISDKQIVTSIITTPAIKEVDTNTHKSINISNKINTKTNNKNIKKDSEQDLKEFMNSFFSEMKNKSFEKRFEVLGKLVEKNINIIGYHNEFYNLIMNENNNDLRKELINLFFEMYDSNSDGAFKPTQEQHEEIKKLIIKMVQNEEIKNKVLTEMRFLLNSNEIESIYNQYGYSFDDNSKSRMLNSYTNSSILEGKDPYSGSLSKEVEKHISKEKLKKRTQDMLGVLAKSSDGSDVTGGSDFLREQLKEPIAGTDPLHYVLWMQAKVTTFSGYQQKAQFINFQFNKISQPYKHEFILRMPTYAGMVENMYTFLLGREQELLQILTDVIRIDDPKVFKALTEFRAIFLFSKNDNLRQGIDRIIKQLIDILPDYQVSLDILKFIKDEQVYIPSSYFNIDSQIQRISSNITTKKNENDLDTGKIPDDNPL